MNFPTPEIFGDPPPQKGSKNHDMGKEPSPDGVWVIYPAWWMRPISAGLDYIPVAGGLFGGNPGTGGFLFFVATIANVVWLQGLTGQSLGKRLMGLRLAHPKHAPYDAFTYYCYPGVKRCAIRYLAHCIEFLCPPIAIWRMIWHSHGKCFADSLVRTVCIKDPDRLIQFWDPAKAKASQGQRIPRGGRGHE